MNRNKIILLAVWLVLVVPGVLTVFRNTPLVLAQKDINTFINWLQRLAAVLAFSLLFVQVILGAFMESLTEKFGGWIFKLHVYQGVVSYALVIIHPLLFLGLNFKDKGVIDPFYVFTDFCAICSTPLELWYTFGRISFWLITVAVFAAIMRKQAWWRIHWRKFHVLNYLAFLLIAIHARFAGTDALTPPFVWIYWFAVVSVLATFIYKYVRPALLKAFPTTQG